MKLKFWTVDAFTNKPFSGNPAAVCLLEDDISDSLKQSIAREMNISETCFITKENDVSFEKEARFGLRWFTPTNEVPLCGHATLAAATVLFKVCKNMSDSIKFSTLSGILVARRQADKVVLDLPLNPPELITDGRFDTLVSMMSCGLSVMQVALCSTTKKLLIRLSDDVSQADLENIRPDPAAMMRLESSGRVKGVMLTTSGDVNSKYDFVSRYFAPWNGIPEDPVTGSAHTVLAPYWTNIIKKQRLIARQCSLRGGDLYLKISEDNRRLDVAGESVIVIEGTIDIS